MKQFFDAVYEAGHKPFDRPIERLAALLRVALALFCVVAVLNSPEILSRHARLVALMLAAYVFFGLLVILLPTIGRLRTGWQLPVHVIDVGFISVLMYFGQRLSTTFFVLYVFVLLGATFRWNWRGALLTTISLPVLQLLLFSLSADRASAQFFIQLAFLFIVGGVFVLFGANREKNEERLAQLAVWPGVQIQSDSGFHAPALDASLTHIATVLQVPRVLVLWEIDEEPFGFESFLAEGKCRQVTITADVISSLVSKELEGITFASEDIASKECITPNGPRKCVDPLISGSVQQRYELSGLCSAPFAGEMCKGRVFMLDRSDWTYDDLMLAEIAAARLQIELQYNAIWAQFRESAASQERVRLARDLHDGLLQNLAAAGLQLASMGSQSGKKTQRELENVRKLLLEEQQRIRAFIEGRQPSLLPRSDLRGELQPSIEQLERQWGCSIVLSIAPQNAKIPAALVQQIEFLLAEATANAIRHGKASHIKVRIERTGNRVRIRIEENGAGLKGITGSYNQNEILTWRIGPQSISRRVNELGGILILSTSTKGTDLCIDLPCDDEKAGTANEKAEAVD